MPKSFPSAAVAEAYAKPRVDMSRAKITHGRPDLELLRKFCYSKFGWSKVSCCHMLSLRAKNNARSRYACLMSWFVATPTL